MLCDVVRRRRSWASALVIHAASHFDHKKRVAWVPISMHTCGSFFYNYGAPLLAAGAPLQYRRRVRDLTYELEDGRHVARLRRRRRAYAPTSNTASHHNHEIDKINS